MTAPEPYVVRQPRVCESYLARLDGLLTSPESSVSAYKRDTVRDAFDGVMNDLAAGRIDGRLVTYDLDLFRPHANWASATLGEGCPVGWSGTRR